MERRAEEDPPIPGSLHLGISTVFYSEMWISKRGLLVPVIGNQMLYISGKTMKPRPAAVTDLLCDKSGCSGCKAGLRCRSWHQTFASENSHTAPACQLADQLSAERERDTIGGVNGKPIPYVPKDYLCFTQGQAQTYH